MSAFLLRVDERPFDVDTQDLGSFSTSRRFDYLTYSLQKLRKFEAKMYKINYNNRLIIELINLKNPLSIQEINKSSITNRYLRDTNQRLDCVVPDSLLQVCKVSNSNSLERAS